MKKRIISVFLIFMILIIFLVPVAAQSPYGGSYPDLHASSFYSTGSYNLVMESRNADTPSIWIKSALPLVVGNYDVAPYSFMTLYTNVDEAHQGAMNTVKFIRYNKNYHQTAVQYGQGDGYSPIWSGLLAYRYAPDNVICFTPEIQSVGTWDYGSEGETMDDVPYVLGDGTDQWRIVLANYDVQFSDGSGIYKQQNLGEYAYIAHPAASSQAIIDYTGAGPNVEVDSNSDIGDPNILTNWLTLDYSNGDGTADYVNYKNWLTTGNQFFVGNTSVIWPKDVVCRLTLWVDANMVEQLDQRFVIIHSTQVETGPILRISGIENGQTYDVQPGISIQKVQGYGDTNLRFLLNGEFFGASVYSKEPDYQSFDRFKLPYQAGDNLLQVLNSNDEVVKAISYTVRKSPEEAWNEFQGEDVTENPLGNAPTRADYTDGILGSIEYGFATLGYWIQYPFRLIGNGLKSFVELVTEGFDWVSRLSAIVGNWFLFLPVEIRNLLLASFVCAIIAFVLSLFRR